METVTHKIRRLQPEMGPAEKKLADYITKNLNEIMGISISELAEKCGCGDATVVRFSRRLGFKNGAKLIMSLMLLLFVISTPVAILVNINASPVEGSPDLINSSKEILNKLAILTKIDTSGNVSPHS